jgi:hypothetical protein
MPSGSLHFVLKEDRCWSTAAILTSWEGFQSRRGPYGTRDRALPSDGAVEIIFAPGEKRSKPLTVSEIESIASVIENDSSVSRAILASLLKKYPSLQKTYAYAGEQKAELMPNIEPILTD